MNITGMNNQTGRNISGMEHIWQSIRDILSTRINTRTMRKQYGSIVPELIDQPGNQITQLRLKAATVMAITRWEPRVRITKVNFSMDMQGQTILDLDGIRRDGPRAGQPFTLSVPVTA